MADLKTRIQEVQERADDHFWAVVAESFPEALAGDVDPAWVFAREKTNIDFIATWLYWNAPSLQDEADDIRDA